MHGYGLHILKSIVLTALCIVGIVICGICALAFLMDGPLFLSPLPVGITVPLDAGTQTGAILRYVGFAVCVVTAAYGILTAWSKGMATIWSTPAATRFAKRPDVAVKVVMAEDRQ
jgi:hypothetical protein